MLKKLVRACILNKNMEIAYLYKKVDIFIGYYDSIYIV